MCQDNICTKYLNIQTGVDSLSISEHLSLEFNKKTFTSSQVGKLSNKFSFSHIGDTLLGMTLVFIFKKIYSLIILFNELNLVDLIDYKVQFSDLY